ncbi:MAG: hypothetical protein K8R58_12285 [Bacteroidales bacterium]|nr:hypothetical protein [Bacteroidales bacterium]
MFRLYIFLLFSLYNTFVYAQYDFNENCKKAYNSIISLKFEEGKQLLELEKSINPSNNIPYYIENYIDFLTLIIGEEQDTFDKLKKNKNIRIKRLEKGDESSPYYRYCLAQVYLQWAFTRVKFREYIPAMLEINKAYRLLEKNKTEFPDFIPNLINLGLLHTLIGTIPDNYKWITNIINVEGTINQGVNEITTVLDVSMKNKEYEYLKTESLFFLSFIELNFVRNKKEALKYNELYYSSKDDETFNSNPLISYSMATIFMRTGFNDDAIEILINRTQGDQYFPFYYLNYLTGVAKLNSLDRDAYKYFFKFLLNFKGINYIKAAYQKLAWFYLVNGNIEKYKEYIAKVLIYGYDIVDADKQAEMEAKSGKIPNIKLLRARLLFDGGYYSKAMNELSMQENKLRNSKDSLECTYRLGRIYHEWGKIPEAIPYYKKTINDGAKFIYYYAANSALMLGFIYENQSDFKNAKYYFTKAQSCNNKEYKNSINQKAKAGLNRIENR